MLFLVLATPDLLPAIMMPVSGKTSCFYKGYTAPAPVHFALAHILIKTPTTAPSTVARSRHVLTVRLLHVSAVKHNPSTGPKSCRQTGSLRTCRRSSRSLFSTPSFPWFRTPLSSICPLQLGAECLKKIKRSFLISIRIQIRK